MGMNYYSVKRGLETLPPDEFWGRRRDENDDILHIGKSSGGWCFTLHVMPERGVEDLWDWIAILLDPERIIINECSEPIEFSGMWRTITDRSWPSPKTWTEADYRRNYAEPGPNNLARHAVGRGCRSQGLGTWDCVEGYFS